MIDIYDELTIEFVEKSASVIRGLYDELRVIDIEQKKVLLYNEGVFIEKGGSCFSEINKRRICDNCISSRAIANKNTFMKIENVDEKIYLISAIPFEFNNRTVAVELIKDVTNTLFYGNSIISGTQKVDDIINDMKELTIKDSLTGIYNRRFIDERLPSDMDICINNNEPISIIMADMDYFKNINDTFGHITGDFVLKEFSKKLKKSMRNKKDWIARYGGEEFLICIPGADEKTALKIAKRMLNLLNSKAVYFNKEKVTITASFGIATLHNKHISIEEFINKADEKLYIAKETGRNKIVI
jgi:two-component system, cell cycle response regulator